MDKKSSESMKSNATSDIATVIETSNDGPLRSFVTVCYPRR